MMTFFIFFGICSPLNQNSTGSREWDGRTTYLQKSGQLILQPAAGSGLMLCAESYLPLGGKSQFYYLI